LAAALFWRSGRGRLAAGIVGGAVFGFISLLVWPFGTVLGGAILGGICGGLGVFAGAALARILHRPTARGCTTLAAVCLVTPFATGLVDLYLRANTP
jgi:hypothetical protein